MEIGLCHLGFDDVRPILDRFSGMVVEDNSRSRCQGANFPVEIHAESGSNWVDIVILSVWLDVHKCLRRNRSIFLTGAPFTVAVIQIPQRFQAVNNLPPLGAGIRLLPFALTCAIGSVVTAGVAGKAKIPPIYLMLGGSAIQVVGFALLSTAPKTTRISHAQYGYEAISGFAVGVNLCCLIMMTPFAVEKRDKCS